ncbi:MAG: phage tail protein [Spirulina sp. SIO3F2]|nr:phage tail protein [Spirulina sp. SIO3F2]
MTELLTECRFYFEADCVSEKQILEISGLSVEASDNFLNATIKMLATTDKDLYTWFRECCSGSANESMARVSAYDQAGIRQALWHIINAHIVKYEGPRFTKADQNRANETIVLAHTGIERVQ